MDRQPQPQLPDQNPESPHGEAAPFVAGALAIMLIASGCTPRNSTPEPTPTVTHAAMPLRQCTDKILDTAHIRTSGRAPLGARLVPGANKRLAGDFTVTTAEQAAAIGATARLLIDGNTTSGAAVFVKGADGTEFAIATAHQVETARSATDVSFLSSGIETPATDGCIITQVNGKIVPLSQFEAKSSKAPFINTIDLSIFKLKTPAGRPAVLAPSEPLDGSFGLYTGYHDVTVNRTNPPHFSTTKILQVQNSNTAGLVVSAGGSSLDKKNRTGSGIQGPNDSGGGNFVFDASSQAQLYGITVGGHNPELSGETGRPFTPAELSAFGYTSVSRKTPPLYLAVSMGLPVVNAAIQGLEVAQAQQPRGK